MKTRALDDNWDWTFGRGKADYLDLGPSVKQRVAQALKCFTRDWVHDLDYGINYFGLMEKPISWAELETSIKTTVLAEYGVSSIIEFNTYYDPDLRAVVYTLIVNDIYGNEQDVSDAINLQGL